MHKIIAVLNEFCEAKKKHEGFGVHALGKAFTLKSNRIQFPS